jgi:histidine ammonia-lyase
MSMGAALKAARVVELAEHVLAIELLAACQAIDLLAPLTTTAPLEAVRSAIRAEVPTLAVDRPPSGDIQKIVAFVTAGALTDACRIDLG